MKYEEIDLFNEEELFNTLEEYQRKIVFNLGYPKLSPEEVAEKWLNSAMSNTKGFGTTSGKTVFYDNIKKEIVRFLCDDGSYIAEKRKLMTQTDITHLFIVSVICTAISPIVGTASAFIAPVVVMILVSVGKITKKAFCDCNKEYLKEAGTLDSISE